ncbi:nitroreductase family protein [Falsiroseomonas sp. CW058]|uniref:nitroreductase family protein n=1 Tax=Falsiroseomonas sp. CW058 TaxID=3388664 RepID=UPI003D3212FF
MDFPAESQTAALTRRYGAGGEPAAPLLRSAVVDSLLAHRSVRAFLPDALPAGALETLVAAASSAPTSSNQQAWSVVAVQDPARKARLAALSNDQGFVARAPLFLCWVADLSRLERLGQAHGRRLEGLDYLEQFMVALVDAALAAQNAVVAAESLGLGTVYVGALRQQPEAVARELGLPPNAFAPFGLSVGHPDPAAPGGIKPRLPQALVLHHERYAARNEAAEVAGYDARLSDYFAASSGTPQDWTAKMLARVGSAAALSGRDRMAEALRALGFGLK